MEASTALSVASRSLPAPVLARLVPVLALSALVVLVLTGLVVFGRRAVGALSQPLSPAVLAGVGVALAGLALWFRRTFAGMPLPRPAAYALWAAPSVAIVIWAAAVSLEGSDTLGLVALFGALLLEEGYSWGRWPADLAAAPPRLPPTTVPPPPQARPTLLEIEEAAALDAAGDEAVTQHVVRRHDEGGDAIEGWLRVEFAAGQRHATAHLAICPPLERVPECFAEQVDGPPARIKVAQVLAYGVRFELRLDEPPAEPANVVVEFAIHEAAASEA